MQTIHLRLDSEVYLYEAFDGDIILVKEVYSILGSEPMVREVGSWSAASESYEAAASTVLWERRSNLMGAVLTNVFLDYAPLFYGDETTGGGGGTLTDGEYCEQEEGPRGVMADVLEAIAADANFTVAHYRVADRKWEGFDDASGRPTGVVGDLVLGRADLSAAGLYKTLGRHEMIDFGVDVLQDKATLHVLVLADESRNAVNIWVYFDALLARSWAALLIFHVAVAAAFCAVAARHRLHPFKDERFSFLNGLALVGILLFQRDYFIFKDRASTKILFLTSCVFAYLVFSGYSAILTSTMISRPESIAVRNFDQALQEGLQIGTMADSAMHDVFRNAPPGSSFGRVNKILTLYDSYSACMALLRTGAGLFAFDSSVPFVTDPDIHPVRAFEDYMSFSIGLAFPKDSELTSFMDYQVLKVEQSGIMPRIMNKYGLEVELSTSRVDDGQQVSSALGYDNLLFPFLSLAGGLVLAGVVGAAEWARTKIRYGK